MAEVHWLSSKPREHYTKLGYYPRLRPYRVVPIGSEFILHSRLISLPVSEPTRGGMIFKKDRTQRKTTSTVQNLKLSELLLDPYLTARSGSVPATT